MKNTQPDKELQAYIHQQISELEPYLLPNTFVNVLVHGEKKQKSVKFSASIAQGTIEAEVADTDIYKAVSDAKKVLLFQIDEITNEVESIEREQKLFALTHGLHHIHWKMQSNANLILK